MSTDNVTEEHDTYSEALERFRRAGDSRMAQQVVDSMRERGVTLGQIHHQLLVRAYLEANDLNNGMRRVREMEEAGFPLESNAKFDLAIATAKAGRKDIAAKFADELEAAGFRAGKEDVGRAFGLFVSLRRLALARSLLRPMGDAGVAGAPADYDVLLEDCVSRRAIKDTLATVEAMLTAGVRVDGERGSELVTMMAAAGHAGRGRELLDKLSAAGVSVGAGAWASLVQAAQKSGDADAVRTVISDMAAAGAAPTSHHRNIMLGASIADGVEPAKAALGAMVDDGVIPTGENLEAAFDAVMGAGDRRGALMILDWMVIIGVPLPASKVAELVGAMLKDGELDQALEVFDDALKLGVPGDRKQGSGLLHELIRAGRLDDAAAFLKRAKKARVLTHGRHFGALVVGFVRGDRLEEALTMLDQMFARKAAPSAGDAAKIVSAVLRTGDHDRTRKLIDDLAGVDVTVDEPTYRELLWAYAKRKQAAPAQAIFERMVAAGITPNHGHEAAIKWAKGETAQNLEQAREEAEQKVVALTEANMAIVAAAAANAPADTTPADTTPADTTPAETKPVEPAVEAPAVEATPEPAAVEPTPDPEPVAAEPEPVAVAPEPDPVAVAPEPVAVAPEPEPVVVEPEPVAVAPEPVAVEPEPVAVAPEPEPEPAAVEPEPVAVAPEPEPDPTPEPEVFEGEAEPEPELPGTEPIQVRDTEIVMDPPKLDGIVVKSDGEVEAVENPDVKKKSQAPPLLRDR